MKQTAVEWLVDELQICATKQEMDLIKQAKEMEKEQIIEAFEYVDFNLDDGLQYYNETYKSEQNVISYN